MRSCSLGTQDPGALRPAFWRLLLVLSVQVGSSPRLYGQCTTETKYIGPRVGQSDTLAAGETVAATFFTFRSLAGATGVNLWNTSTTSITFKGRTGENTYAFTISREDKKAWLGSGQPDEVNKPPPEEVVVWWERADTPVEVGPIEFQLSPHGGSPIITVTKALEEYSGPCRR